MKRLILIVSLLASTQAFANACDGDDHIAIRYWIWNQTEYSIALKFDEAESGGNPDNIYLQPRSDPIDDYGCSNGLLIGYKSRATLVISGDSDVDLAYLSINNPFAGSGSFSYDPYDITSPRCSCRIQVGTVWSDMTYYDCSSYTGPMTLRTEIRISCTQSL